MLYKYHNQYVNLDDHNLAKIIGEEERRHRNGTVKYRPLGLSQEQVASLKKDWPPDRVKQLSARAKEINEQVVERRAYTALSRMLMMDVCEPKSPACKFAAIELAFSMLTNTIPSLRFEAKSNFVERVVQGKKFRLRPSTRFAKIVIPEKDVKLADFYVFGLYVEAIDQCWLLGWASQEDVANGKRGNWTLDKSLSWNEMSYYKEPEDLRPMADLIRQMGIETIPDGTIFEAVPNQTAIPMNNSIKNIEALLDAPATSPLTIIPGIDDPQPKQEPEAEAEAEAEPKREEQAASPDDYQF